MLFVPKPSGTLRVQFAKPFDVVAVTPLTVTLPMPDNASELVPLKVIAFAAVDVPEAGKVIATTGPSLSCVLETMLLLPDAPMLLLARSR